MTAKVSRFAVNPELIDENDLCTCGDSECPDAKAVLDAALAKLKKLDHVQLFYRSQGDCLSKEQITELFMGNIVHVEEQILEWWNDNDQWAMDAEIEQLVDSDEKEMLSIHELLNDLRDAILEKDESDPFGELVDATDDVWVRVEICNVSDECWDDPDTLEWEIESIVKTGSMRRDLNEQAIRELLCNERAYGSACLLFRATMKDLVAHVFGAHEWGSMPVDPKLRVDSPILWIEGYTRELHGMTSAELDMKIDPHLELDYYPDGRYSSDDFEVIGRFDEYKRELEEFFDYRQKILERQTG